MTLVTDRHSNAQIQNSIVVLLPHLHVGPAFDARVSTAKEIWIVEFRKTDRILLKHCFVWNLMALVVLKNTASANVNHFAAMLLAGTRTVERRNQIVIDILLQTPRQFQIINRIVLLLLVLIKTMCAADAAKHDIGILSLDLLHNLFIVLATSSTWNNCVLIKRLNNLLTNPAARTIK